MSNLPPGVNEGMIPGNRPEDLEEEAFFDALESALDAKLGPEKFKRWVVLFDNAEDEELIVQAVRIARELGYERGAADARMEADIIEGLREAIRGETVEIPPLDDEVARRLDG